MGAVSNGKSKLYFDKKNGNIWNIDAGYSSSELSVYAQ